LSKIKLKSIKTEELSGDNNIITRASVPAFLLFPVVTATRYVARLADLFFMEYFCLLECRPSPFSYHKNSQ